MLNPRVIAAHDSVVLRHDLSRSGLSPERISELSQDSCSIALVFEEVDALIAARVSEVFRQIGGNAVIGSSTAEGELVLLGARGHFTILRHRLVDGEESVLAAAATAALDDYCAPRGKTIIGDKEFVWGVRTYMMGIVNVTPDSFSGDGVGSDIGAALALAEQQVSEGADIVDVGGQSTRPGSERIEPAEELHRILPVVRRLAKALPVPVSIDTYRAAVAEPCLDAGAALVNDVWGLRGDPAMNALIARRGVQVILMHNQQGIAYRNLMADLIRALRVSVALAREAGVRDEHIIVDPGIGFGKSKEQNLELLHRLQELKVLGRPILLGTSRKSTIGYVLNLPPDQRVEGTAATVALGIAQGADIVRVHDVRQQARVAKMADAIVRWQPSSGEAQHWPGQTG